MKTDEKIKEFESVCKPVVEWLQKNGNPIMLELRIAKGTNGVYIGDNTFFRDGNQYEFLLGEDLMYTVIGSNTVGDVPYLIMEVRND